MSSLLENFQNSSSANTASSCQRDCGGKKRKGVLFGRGSPPPAFTIKEEEFAESTLSSMANSACQSGRNNCSRFFRRSWRNGGQKSGASSECSTSRSGYSSASKRRNDFPSINTSYSIPRGRYHNPNMSRTYQDESFKELLTDNTTTLSTVDTFQSPQLHYESFVPPRASSKKGTAANCSPECSELQNQGSPHGVASSTPNDPKRNVNVDSPNISPITKRELTNSFVPPHASSKKGTTASCSPECSELQNQEGPRGIVSSTPYGQKRNVNLDSPNISPITQRKPMNSQENSMRFASLFTSTLATGGSIPSPRSVSPRQHIKDPKLPRQYYEQHPSFKEINENTYISPGLSPPHVRDREIQKRDFIESLQATTGDSTQCPASVSAQEYLNEPVMLPQEYIQQYPSVHEDGNNAQCIGTSRSFCALKSASASNPDVDKNNFAQLPHPHQRQRSYRPEYYETTIDPYETIQFPNVCRRLFITESSAHDPSSLHNTSTNQGHSEAVQQQQQQQRHSAAVSPATSREYTQASAQQSAQAQRSFYNNTGTYQESQYESTVYADIPNFAQPYDGTVYAAIPDMMVQQYGNNVYADLPNLAQQRSFRERSPERQRSSFIDSYPRENNRQHQQLSQQQQQQQQQQQEQQQQQQQQQQRSTPCSRECSRSPSEQQQSYGESSHEQELSCTCDLTDERSVHNRRKQICKEASEKLKSFKRELEHELYVMEGEEFTEMDKSLKKWQKMRRKIMMKFLCVQFLRDLEKSGRSRSQSRPRQEDCPC